MAVFILTPQNRVLLEKLTGFQLLKKFSAIYGTPRFITAFTSARFVYVFTNFDRYKGWNFNSGNYLFTTDTK